MISVEGGSGSSALIRVSDLDKVYVRGEEEIHVLQGLNLDVDKGDFVAFMGPSGSGKTTLLNLLGGLDLPTRGSITVAAMRSPAFPTTRSPTGGRATLVSSSRCTTSFRC